jgi:hypothetical protein
MRTAGRAYVMGIFGALGVGTAILGVAGIVVLIGERKIKKVISEFEKDMRARLEDLTGIPDEPPNDKS